MCHVGEKYRPLLGGCPPSYSSYPRLSMEYIAVLAPSDNHCKIDTSSNNMITWWLVIIFPAGEPKKTPSHRSHQTQEIPNQVYNFYNLSTKFLQFPATAMSAGPKQNRLGSSPEVPSAGPSGWCNCRGERSRIGGGETWANHGASWWIMAGRNSLHRFCF